MEYQMRSALWLRLMLLLQRNFLETKMNRNMFVWFYEIAHKTSCGLIEDIITDIFFLLFMIIIIFYLKIVASLSKTRNMKMKAR